MSSTEPDQDVTVTRLFSWDWKDQPNLDAIAAAVTELSANGQVFMREIDTGGDNYAWVVSDAELTEALGGASPGVQAGDSRLPSVRLALILDVRPDDRQGRPAARRGEVGRGPQVIPVGTDPVPLPEPAGGTPFREFTSAETFTLGGYSIQQMHVVILAVALHEDRRRSRRRPSRRPPAEMPIILPRENATPVFRHEDQMHVERGNHMPATPVIIGASHETNMVQFGCAREIPLSPLPGPRSGNDAGPDVQLRPGGVQRLPAAAGGVARGREKMSDTEVQRRVITLAKTTPERAWLGEVASVPLVQACQDARRAYRNWFVLPVRETERPQGRAPQVPVPERSPAVGPAHPQRVRPAGHRLYVAKVGRHRGPLVPGPSRPNRPASRSSARQTGAISPSSWWRWRQRRSQTPFVMSAWTSG